MNSKQTIVILLILALVVSSVFIVACTPEEVDGEVQVSITNKNELTAAWTQGDADRKLQVNITVGGQVVIDKAYTVSTSNSGVVSVADDNVTVTAKGGGTATLTVNIDGVTDSVKITVIPRFKGVSITNKNALAVLTVGDADRSLSIQFTPNYYQTNKPKYTVTSSDPSVVEIGADDTLKAKNIGEATIMVKVDDQFDTVTIKVISCQKIEFVSGTTEFEVDDNFTCNDVVVRATYSNGETKTVPHSDLKFDSSKFDSSKKGTYQIAVSAYGVQCTYEVKVVAKGLNVLMIGNSFSEDTVQWTYDIAKDLGIERVNICNMYIGGCSIDYHANNAVDSSAVYDLQIYDGTEWQHNYNKTLLYGIQYYKWDFISLQQASGESGVASSYVKLQRLMDFVKENATNSNVKIIWNMTWAYSANSTHIDFAKYDKNQTKMYNAIVDCVKTQVLTKDIYKVIPNGTAIQNARTSYIGDNLTRDGFHLSYDMGRFVAGLNLVYTLTGADITKLTYAPSGVSESYKNIAIESVLNAAKEPYAVTNSQYTIEPDSITDEEIKQKNLVKMNYFPVGNAYYNSTDSACYNKLVTNLANCPNFVASAVRFTKEQLPVGSVIIIKKGWQYRPEGWIDDAQQSSRPDNVTTTRVDVDESWWKNYKYRAFNISRTDSASLNGNFTEAMDALTIYVPQGTPVAKTIDYSANDGEILTANGKDINNFKLLDLMPVIGFYNSSETTTPTVRVPHDLNNQFVTCDGLTKAMLPEGAVIIVDAGYKCRPDAWKNGTKTAAADRPDSVGSSDKVTVIEVTSDWWGDFDVRGLNVSTFDSSNVTQASYEILGHIRVYVPNVES